MQTFTHHSSMTYIPDTDAESYVLLDIETTGLSPEYAAVFMIGCGYYENHCFHTIHWLADTYDIESEQAVLENFSIWFLSQISKHPNTKLITYNGHQFDLPFLKNRFDQCHLMYPLDESNPFCSIDYYRIISKCKHLWPLKNTKLHSVADWLGYHCSKTPSGRQLIKTYHSYIKTKDPALLNLLFLHNIDDLEALSTVISIDNYLNFFNKNWQICEITNTDEYLSIHIQINEKHLFPVELNLEKYGFHVNFKTDALWIHIPLYSNGLRYYYRDINNYVYLPDEDHVLHKSMSKYIDKSHYVKATPETCYTWFQPDHHFFEESEKQKAYIRMIFELFGLF